MKKVLDWIIPNRRPLLSRFVLIAMLVVASISLSLAQSDSEPPATTADPQNALVLGKTVAQQMLEALADDATRTDMAALRGIVDEYLVPHIDFRISSSLVLAQHWKTASEAQRIEFIHEFRAFLVRFYTEALGGYVKTNEIPSNLFEFSDEVDVKSERQVFITSKVKQPDGGAVPVVYRMVWNQAWRVVDVSLKGISMVKTYRANFVSTVESKGLDALIQQLKERNATLGT